MPIRSALAITAMMAVATSARAEQIRCVADDRSRPVTISLKSQRFAGRELSCVSGEFIDEPGLKQAGSLADGRDVDIGRREDARGLSLVLGEGEQAQGAGDKVLSERRHGFPFDSTTRRAMRIAVT